MQLFLYIAFGSTCFPYACMLFARTFCDITYREVDIYTVISGYCFVADILVIYSLKLQLEYFNIVAILN